MAERMISASRRSYGGDQTRPDEQIGSPVSESQMTVPGGSAAHRRIRRGALCGERLGSYQLGELLGVGGMAEVYRALDLLLDREVAVKVLAAHLADNAEYVERFRAEAHRVGSLSHPHLVPIYHAGEAEVQGRRLLYLVMPLLRESLRDLRRREGKLSPAEASWLVLQVADGLDAAHRSGIIHRDVKPGNVLLDTEGHPQLADFGIARELCATSPSGVAPTQPEEIVGTPEYMAPEQLRGAAIDQRADVYALGAVFYELLTGRLPFDGTTAYDLAAHVLHAPLTPPSALAPDVVPAVERVVLTALSRDPAERYATAGAFALALRQAFVGRREKQRLPDLSGQPLAALPMWDSDVSPTMLIPRLPWNRAWWSAERRHRLGTLLLTTALMALLMGSVRIFSTFQIPPGAMASSAASVRATSNPATVTPPTAPTPAAPTPAAPTPAAPTPAAPTPAAPTPTTPPSVGAPPTGELFANGGAKGDKPADKHHGDKHHGDNSGDNNSGDN
jgi:eukaryotic-like serine/threonine-protein kinase